MTYNTYRPVGYNVQPGEILNLKHFYKVVEHKVTSTGPVVLVQSVTDPNQLVEVSESLINQQFYSSDYVAEEVEIPLTQVEEVFLSAGDTIFSVLFKKQDGTSRLLKGTLTGKISLGRAQVIDCEKNEVRLVDLREIDWVILQGTKFVVKGKKKTTKAKVNK